ncbi:unnamed protein product [Bursaphelenchus okinawaensis]|uniref:Uncharacterized protein n=1 Tax=Bursaphelenchus okinawaensis TaxID=465554 RepID=A0A811KA13_9BILA|nr:unnamed protein product [Bursaphelenchus okinawaensis]CAG9096748.1 unnamed protein product [Bursaphelenchus okinawaensis]
MYIFGKKPRYRPLEGDIILQRSRLLLFCLLFCQLLQTLNQRARKGFFVAFGNRSQQRGQCFKCGFWEIDHFAGRFVVLVRTDSPAAGAQFNRCWLVWK